MTDYQNLQETLKTSFSKLPPTLQDAATFLLENPGKIATLSMRQVAAETGIVLGNFPRLAKALGFETYNELRAVYSAHVQSGFAGAYHIRAGALQVGSVDKGQQEIWEEFRSAAHRNVDAVFEQNHLSSILAAAHKLSSAKTIYVVGMQASLSSSIYAKYLGSMISNRFRMISGHGGVLADDIMDIGPEDALLAVAMQPCSAFTIRLAQIAKDAGAQIVAITDSDASPLGLTTQDVFLTPNVSPMFFDSYLGVTLLLEVLLGFLTIESKEAVARIETMEKQRKRMGEYWQDEND